MYFLKLTIILISFLSINLIKGKEISRNPGSKGYNSFNKIERQWAEGLSPEEEADQKIIFIVESLDKEIRAKMSQRENEDKEIGQIISVSYRQKIVRPSDYYIKLYSTGNEKYWHAFITEYPKKYILRRIKGPVQSNDEIKEF